MTTRPPPPVIYFMRRREERLHGIKIPHQPRHWVGPLPRLPNGTLRVSGTTLTT
jgi:hypothetical protein